MKGVRAIMRRFMKGLTVLFVLTLLVLGAYAFGIGYYANRFQANTKIANVDVSNLTLVQAEELIEEEMLDHKVTLNENGKSIGTIELKDLDPVLTNKGVIEKVYKSQNPNHWLFYYFQGDTYDASLLSGVEMDHKLLTERLKDLGVDNTNRTAPKDAQLDYQEGKGYELAEEETGNQIDLAELMAGFYQELSHEDSQLELSDYYSQPKVTSQDEDLQEIYQEVEEALSTKITLKIKDHKEVIPKEEIAKWVYFDENNEIVYDETLVSEFLKTYNEKYASYLNPRQFQSTNQGTVTVQPGTLGWSIDRETEAKQIVADLYAQKDVERDPAIIGTGYDLPGNEIGDTYVEVDLTYQTMYVYQNGQMVISTPIVSGRAGIADTIPGAYAIWNKEMDAKLKGYNWIYEKEYTTPVKYWMPFDTVGQGIHDASWQPTFGGDWYLSNGSLGCINTPTNVMAQVFNTVEVGTPVIIF